MKTKKQLQTEIEKLQKQLKELENQPIGEWYEYKKGWEITTTQQFNGKTYSEILEIVDESQIAIYQLLQDLRNEGLEFLKDFWVFTPNPDKVCKENGKVAGFFADSDGAAFYCNRGPDCRDDSLGVFLIRKKRSDKKDGN